MYNRIIKALFESVSNQKKFDKTIALVAGSFKPPHFAHLYISYIIVSKRRKIMNNVNTTDESIQNNPVFKELPGLPFPPKYEDDFNDMPPPGMIWIYTCPKCGNKMYTPAIWNGIVPPPCVCRKCGYTYYPENKQTIY